MRKAARCYNGPYQNEYLNQVAFPMGGMGAGMICLEGTGAFSHVSLRHKPEVFNEPLMFAALHVKGAPAARVLEGPVPMRKAFGAPGAGNGIGGRSYGLPRFAKASFATRFPFGIVRLDDKTMPVKVELTGWSPFVPGDADNASLPVAGLEYRLRNHTNKIIAGVFSFHAGNFMRINEKADGTVSPIKGGFILGATHGAPATPTPATPEKPAPSGQFAAFTLSPGIKTDCAWFRGTWFDILTMLWKNIATGKSQTKPPFAEGKRSDGGSFYVPFEIKARAEQTVRVLLAWHVPQSSLCLGDDAPCDCKRGVNEPAAYVPWYATRFKDIHAVADYWRTHYDTLRARSKLFSDCFYDTTLPPELVEAVAANLTILKSPTVLRQHDGRLWGWEGCCDSGGCCHGSCTHVWNYAQALCHLFPDLERTLRETEFFVDQDDRGHQMFRAPLPIRPPAHNFHAAADGQLGGIIKVHREWRISGDTAWMKNLWPKVKQSLDYCIATWDPGHAGTLVEPHHNTYDIEFWGADGMCTSFYLGALAAAIRMGRESDADVTLYNELLAKGKKAMETKLWNGEFFFQRIQWTGLRAADPTTAQSACTNYTPEAVALLKKEGPKYQYGNGCLSDGVIGDWLARCSGVGPVLDTAKTARHLGSVFAHNFKEDLSDHANPQRPSYAFGQEGGLLLCSWPGNRPGGKLSLPFPYSDEVWTGIEYQVAAHLIMMGQVKEGLRIVRTARDRYDGRYRNPFNEYECGQWYARAMSSYGLLQALSGARYDAVEKTLHLQPAIKGDFKAFLSTATGFGTVGVRNGKPFLKVVAGKIDVKRIVS